MLLSLQNLERKLEEERNAPNKLEEKANGKKKGCKSISISVNPYPYREAKDGIWGKHNTLETWDYQQDWGTRQIDQRAPEAGRDLQRTAASAAGD